MVVSVDLAAWEPDKENVQPLKEGRNAAVLADIFQRRKLGSEAERQHDEERQLQVAAFEARLVATQETNDDDDCKVGAWSEYVHWASQHFPSDQSVERAILERATCALAEDQSCRDDLRHLKLWLRLASMMREPAEVFSFLHTRELGTGHALFYERWSSFLETRGRFAEAEEVLDVGLARTAEPIASLRSSREAMDARMRERIKQSSDRNDGDQQLFSQGLPIQEHVATRPALNDLTAREAKRMRRPVGERRPTQQDVFGLGAGSCGGVATNVAEVEQLFSIIADYDDAPHASIFDVQSEWRGLPAAEAISKKENEVGVSRGLFQPASAPCTNDPPRRRRGARPSAERQRSGELHIFVDEEFAASPGVGNSSSTPANYGAPPKARHRVGSHGGAGAEQGAGPAGVVAPEAEEDLASRLKSLRLGDRLPHPPAKRTCMHASAMNDVGVRPTASNGSGRAELSVLGALPELGTPPREQTIAQSSTLENGSRLPSCAPKANDVLGSSSSHAASISGSLAFGNATGTRQESSLNIFDDSESNLTGSIAPLCSMGSMTGVCGSSLRRSSLGNSGQHGSGSTTLMVFED